MPRIPIVCLLLGEILCASPATSARLEQVIDLVDQGTPLALDSLAARSWSQGRTDGRITVVNLSYGPPNLYGIYLLDPTAGTSAQLASVDPSSLASMLSGVLPIPTPSGDVYFVIEDIASGVQQDLYRLEGTVLVPVLDLTAAGIEVGFEPALDTVWGGASLAGVLRIVYRVETASNQFEVIEIDPSLPAAAVASRVQTATEFPAVRPAFDPAGVVYLVVSERPEPTEPRSERLYRVDGDTLTAVADIRASGFQLHLDGAITGELATNVTSSGTVQALLRPDSFSNFTLLEIDPASGATTPRTTVRPSSAFDEPGQMLPIDVGAHPAFGLDGASFFVIGEVAIGDPRQGLFRNRFRSSTTRVVDVTAQGVTVEAGLATIPIGVARDSSVRASVPHPLASDLRRLYRFDPLSGLAFPPVTADLADTGSSPLLAYTAFGPGGEVYYVVSDGGMPPRQGVWRFDDGPLTEVVDLTAEGVEINPAGAIPEPFLGVADDGTIQLFDPHPLLPDVFKLFRFDPSDGSAETLATLDLSLLAMAPIAGHAEAFGPGGELHVLVITMDFPTQQTVYRRDGATLVPVADLTAQGIELGTNAGLTPIQAAARADGLLRIVDLDPGSMSTRRVHSVDPSTGEAWLEAMLDTRVLCCGDLAGTSPVSTALGRDDDLYLLAIGDGASLDPQQSIFRLRLAPEPTAPVLQLAAFAILALLARPRRRAPIVRPRRSRSAPPERRERTARGVGLVPCALRDEAIGGAPAC